MQRPPTVGQRLSRVCSASSTSRVWRRENSDFRCRTSGCIMTPALSSWAGAPNQLRPRNVRGLLLFSSSFLVQIRSDFHCFLWPRSHPHPEPLPAARSQDRSGFGAKIAVQNPLRGSSMRFVASRSGRRDTAGGPGQPVSPGSRSPSLRQPPPLSSIQTPQRHRPGAPPTGVAPAA